MPEPHRFLLQVDVRYFSPRFRPSQLQRSASSAHSSCFRKNSISSMHVFPSQATWFSHFAISILYSAGIWRVVRFPAGPILYLSVRVRLPRWGIPPLSEKSYSKAYLGGPDIIASGFAIGCYYGGLGAGLFCRMGTWPRYAPISY